MANGFLPVWTPGVPCTGPLPVVGAKSGEEVPHKSTMLTIQIVSFEPVFALIRHPHQQSSLWAEISMSMGMSILMSCDVHLALTS